MSSLRNCDGYSSEGPHKDLVRGIRGACVKSAQTKGSFNARRPGPKTLIRCAHEFVDRYIDQMPVHFVTHLMYGAEVLAYAHPDEKVRAVWEHVYNAIVNHMHLRPETFTTFMVRLSDDPKQVDNEDKLDEVCYFSGEYGDNTGGVNES